MPAKATKTKTSPARTAPEKAGFTLREARLEDFEEIYDIFRYVLNEGKTYSYTLEEMTPDRSLA
ncbi:MAG: hypothetical protein K2Q01_08220, partial [Rickettsiales bacterium]|nr:hypothetical protein [Rickettsiales bacterium]